MNRKSSFVRALAEQLFANPWQESVMIKSIYWLLDDRPDWVAPLIHRIRIQFSENRTVASAALLAQFIDLDPGFQKIWHRHRQTLRIKQYRLTPLPTRTSIDCEQPSLRSITQLLQWLGLSHGQLENYSRHWKESNTEYEHRRYHYHYYWRIQKQGGKRLIEAPKRRMAEVQRQIYRGILNRLTLHDACCGFRKDYSRIQFVGPHSGKQVVIKMDLLHFFTSIPFRRIHAVFTALGYSHEISSRLAGLCCNHAPRSVIDLNPELSWHQRQLLAKPHLPQGSPSSPALANLCAFRLDVRLSAFAKKWGANYSRYADEGFSVNHRKTKMMRQATSQRLTGLTVNRFPNYSRKNYDQLKATLHNCVKYGPESQNRKRHPAFQAHLLGRISEIHSLNPNRFSKLKKLYSQILW